MNYSEYGSLAYEKIKEYGAPMAVVRSGAKVYDASTNSYVDSGVSMSGYAVQQSFDQKNIDGTNIRFGDALFMASLDDVPKTNDTISFSGKSYTVVNVDILSPDGKTNVVYRIQAR